MPSPEERLNQIEPVIGEILVKQDQLAAQVSQLSTQVRQQNASLLNQLTDQGQRIDKLENGLGELKAEVSELRTEVNQGFALVNSRLTDLFTLLGERIR